MGRASRPAPDIFQPHADPSTKGGNPGCHAKPVAKVGRGSVKKANEPMLMGVSGEASLENNEHECREPCPYDHQRACNPHRRVTDLYGGAGG